MTKKDKKYYSIKEAAEMLDVCPDTIKYWERKNLIPPPKRNPKNNYRIYTLEDIKLIAKMRGVFVTIE